MESVTISDLCTDQCALGDKYSMQNVTYYLVIWLINKKLAVL